MVVSMTDAACRVVAQPFEAQMDQIPLQALTWASY